MGVFRMLMNVGKARIARKVFRHGLGGNVATALTVAWLGKKIVGRVLANRRTRAQRWG